MRTEAYITIESPWGLTLRRSLKGLDTVEDIGTVWAVLEDICEADNPHTYGFGHLMSRVSSYNLGIEVLPGTFDWGKYAREFIPDMETLLGAISPECIAIEDGCANELLYLGNCLSILPSGKLRIPIVSPYENEWEGKLDEAAMEALNAVFPYTSVANGEYNGTDLMMYVPLGELEEEVATNWCHEEMMFVFHHSESSSITFGAMMQGGKVRLFHGNPFTDGMEDMTLDQINKGEASLTIEEMQEVAYGYGAILKRLESGRLIWRKHQYTYHYHGERGEFVAYVEDPWGVEVWREEMVDGIFQPFYDGFMKNKDDLNGLKKHLLNQFIMPEEADLISSENNQVL